MCKPVYVGISILNISKTNVYRFYYNVLKKENNENIEMLYNYTDGFLLYIKRTNFYDAILKMYEHFYTSDYPKDHYCYSEKNKKVLGTGRQIAFYSLVVPPGKVARRRNF
jgi:hypothetical protein